MMPILPEHIQAMNRQNGPKQIKWPPVPRDAAGNAVPSPEEKPPIIKKEESKNITVNDVAIALLFFAIFRYL